MAVANELHVTRAAERLGMRQPPLSMQIRQLEEAVGAPLFRRLARGVSLTPAGHAFLIEANIILESLERGVDNVRRYAGGEMGHLRIGLAGAIYYNALIPGILRAYRSKRPAATLSIEQNYTPNLVESVACNRLDLAIVRPIPEVDGRTKFVPLAEEQFLIAFPTGHPLGSMDEFDPAVLAKESWVMFARPNGPGLYDAIIGLCHRIGFEPRIGQISSRIASVVPLVSAGFGLAIVPEPIAVIHCEGVNYRKIPTSIGTASVVMAVRSAEPNVQIQDFVAVAKRIAKEPRWSCAAGPSIPAAQ